MPHARPFLLLAGCHTPSPQPDRAQLIEQRKDAAIGQLADCESGQDRPRPEQVAEIRAP